MFSITVHDSPQNNPWNFENAEGLLRWLENEERFWRNQVPSQFAENADLGVRFAELRKLATLYGTSQSPTDAVEIRRRIEGYLSAGYFDSLGPKAQWLTTLDSEPAREIAFGMLKGEWPQHQLVAAQELDGFVRFLLFQAAPMRQLQEGMNSFREQQADHAKKAALTAAGFQTRAKQHDEALQALDTTKANLDKAAKDYQSALPDALKHSAEIQKFRDEWDSKLQAVAESYNKYVAAEGPATYWQEQQRAFRGRAGWLGLMFVSFIGAAAYFLAESTPLIFEDKVSYRTLFVVAAAFTLFLLPLRVILKALMTSLHLEADAAHRTVVAKSYLALTRGETDKRDDRARRAALIALFRPTRTGLVRDDSGPAGVLDAIAKVVSK